METLRKMWRWLTLADVPAQQPATKAADECDHCCRPAVHHVTWRSYGPRGVTVLYTQTCEKHKPLAQNISEDLSEALVEPVAVWPGW